MADEKKQALTPEELKAQQGEGMIVRDEMSHVNANVAAPTKARNAANVLSDDVAATAAVQYAPINRSAP